MNKTLKEKMEALKEAELTAYPTQSSVPKETTPTTQTSLDELPRFLGASDLRQHISAK